MTSCPGDRVCSKMMYGGETPGRSFLFHARKPHHMMRGAFGDGFMIPLSVCIPILLAVFNSFTFVLAGKSCQSGWIGSCVIMQKILIFLAKACYIIFRDSVPSNSIHCYAVSGLFTHLLLPPVESIINTPCMTLVAFHSITTWIIFAPPVASPIIGSTVAFQGRTIPTR